MLRRRVRATAHAAGGEGRSHSDGKRQLRSREICAAKEPDAFVARAVAGPIGVEGSRGRRVRRQCGASWGDAENTLESGASVTDEHSRLLSEVAARLQAVEQRLASTEAAQEAALKQYGESDAAYRNELSAYREERKHMSGAKLLATVLRVATVVLLLYVSYRVSA